MLSYLLLFLNKMIDTNVRRIGEKRLRIFPTTANRNHILILKWDDAGQAWWKMKFVGVLGDPERFFRSSLFPAIVLLCVHIGTVICSDAPIRGHDSAALPGLRRDGVLGFLAGSWPHRAAVCGAGRSCPWSQRRTCVYVHRTGLSCKQGQRQEAYEARAHDSWALLLRHHANVEWHGVRSEYRLDNPVTLRNHHGRPGKRIRVLDADNHGTLVSTLRPVRRTGVRSAGGANMGAWGDCTWEEEEEYQLRHLRDTLSTVPASAPPPPTLCVREMQGADAGAVTCVEEGYCRSWLSPSAFGGPTLSIEFALRFDDWRTRTEIRYHRGCLVSAVSVCMCVCECVWVSTHFSIPPRG